MNIAFELDDNEKAVTPMKTADALIDWGGFTNKDLKELIAYLSVYTRYNH